ncbi:MAG: signal peptidase II [Alkalinema sp. CACIAM 70d]|nr:MAG: signal peptidase II [Alkalinema sp. CACIAM 70d]
MRNPFFWLLAISSLVLDRLTKLWILDHLPLCPKGWPFELCHSIPIVPGVFHLTHVWNDGAAWSSFRGAWWLPFLSLAVSLGLMGLAFFGPRLSRWEQAGYSLVFSGAIGNGIDRFAFDGHVVDFLDFRLIHFPVFNVADTVINIGIACLLIASFRRPNPASKEDSVKSSGQ